MIRRTVLSALVLTIGLGGVVSRAEGQATTTLNISILEPSPPITTSDVIRLEAFSSEFGFPDTGHIIYSSFVVEGYCVDWRIFSEMTGGYVYPVAQPMRHVADLGPLPAGRYDVTATWDHIGDERPDLVGTVGFTVVPEPCAAVMITAWCMILIGLVRRHHGLNQQADP